MQINIKGQGMKKVIMCIADPTIQVKSKNITFNQLIQQIKHH